MIRRRDWFFWAGARLALFGCPAWLRAAPVDTARLLFLIELRGGNDALNTVVPFEEGRYFDLRPRLALRGEDVVPLARGLALHPALAPLRPLWDAGEMAIVQGVGYPNPELSHFRSIEIWDTASAADQYLHQGWLTRAAAAAPVFRAAALDGIVLGASDLGPFAGGARAIVTSDPSRLARAVAPAAAPAVSVRGALAHLVRVESDLDRAALALRNPTQIETEFPRTPLGFALQRAAEVAATRRVPVFRVTLAGFDTHRNQAAIHSALLRQLGDGIVALRTALQAAGLWQDTLVMTYSEFGRRPRENASGGTDHGTAGVMFAFGAGVAGGVLGAAPSLARLDADGNLRYTTDFRAVYATVLERWWQVDSVTVLGTRFAPLPMLRV